jgi:hypothetical protein
VVAETVAVLQPEQMVLTEKTDRPLRMKMAQLQLAAMAAMAQRPLSTEKTALNLALEAKAAAAVEAEAAALLAHLARLSEVPAEKAAWVAVAVLVLTAAS